MGRYLSTGNKLLDELLGGGFLAGVTNTIYGDPGSGKTTIIMSAIINALKDSDDNARALIIDTEAGWSQARIASMAEAHGIDVNEALKKIRVYKVTKLAEQHEVVMKIFEEDIKTNNWRPILFAVDSIASIYHSQLLNTQTALLASVARMLQGKLSTEIGHLLDTADVYEVPAIIVSWSRSPAADSFQKRKRVEALKAIQSGDPEFDLEAGLGAWEYPIVGGRHLIYYSKVLLHLRTLEITSGEKLAVLEKSIEQPSNRCVRFQIGQKGIEGTEKEKVQSLQEYLHKIAEEKVDE